MNGSTLVVIALVSSVASIAAQGAQGDDPFDEEVTGPYCGLYSAARLASLVNRNSQIDLDQYASSDYVAGAEGSTPNQISKLLEENGISVSGVRSLGAADLFASNGPWIANVRHYPESTAFDHWVCVHPEGRRVAVYDGPGPVQYVSLGEFLR